MAWSLSFNSSASSIVTLERIYLIYLQTYSQIYTIIFCQVGVWLINDDLYCCVDVD